MTLGYKTKEPGSFWAQWTVLEYEQKNGLGNHKVQFAPVFVGDNEFDKTYGWGMEKTIAHMKFVALMSAFPSISEYHRS